MNKYLEALSGARFHKYHYYVCSEYEENIPGR